MFIAAPEIEIFTIRPPPVFVERKARRLKRRVRRCGLRLSKGGKSEGQRGNEPGHAGREVAVRNVAARLDGVNAKNH